MFKKCIVYQKKKKKKPKYNFNRKTHIDRNPTRLTPTRFMRNNNKKINMKIELIPRNMLKINKSIVEIERGCNSLE